MAEENLIEKANREAEEAKKKAKDALGNKPENPETTIASAKETEDKAREIANADQTKVSAAVSQNAVDADRNKRDRTVLDSVNKSLTTIAEELRLAVAKLAGNVDQTTLDRLATTQQQLDSIK